MKIGDLVRRSFHWSPDIGAVGIVLKEPAEKDFFSKGLWARVHWLGRSPAPCTWEEDRNLRVINEDR